MNDIKNRVDQISDTSNIHLNTMPTSAKIEISGRCNMNCQFCFQRIMKENNLRQRIMGPMEFQKVLDFLETIPSLKEVGLFYMGEPGLNASLKYYMMQLKDKDYFTYLTTNGTILDTVKEAIPYIDSLKVSWNYRNIEDFKQKTHAPEEMYDRIIHNISELRKECSQWRKKLTVSTVLDGDRDEYTDVLNTLDYDEHYWIPLQTQCGINSEGSDGVIGEDDNKRKPIPCWSLFKCLYVDVDMNVRACCYGHNDCHILYNIKDQKEFILSDTIIRMRQDHLDNKVPPECSECLRGVNS